MLNQGVDWWMDKGGLRGRVGAGGGGWAGGWAKEGEGERVEKGVVLKTGRAFWRQRIPRLQNLLIPTLFPPVRKSCPLVTKVCLL